MRPGWCRWAGVTVALALVALPVRAQFQAADLLYVPAVAHNTGLEGSVWRTDLYVTNVDTVPIDVIMVYLPSGVQGNANVFTDRSLWLGGRESDGVGFVNEALADIPPKGTVLLPDVVGEYWQGQLGLNGVGAMVVFAQEAGSLQEDGSRVYRNAVVNARVYNKTKIYEPDPDNEGLFLEVPATYGQGMPGVPWYDLADPAAVSDDVDFTYQVLTGGTEKVKTRYDVGILNASDLQTSITVAIQPFDANGDPFVDDQGNARIQLAQLPPLAHLQYNRLLYQMGINKVDQVTLRVSFVGWSSTNPDPMPAFTCYGSVINNASNDPSTVLPSFAFPFNVDCLFPDVPASTLGVKARSASGRARGGRRPLQVPPR